MLWLGAIDALRQAGHAEAADDLIDELVRFVLSDPKRTSALAAAGYGLVHPVPESELRAMWGDR